MDPDLIEARQDALEHSMCKHVVNAERPLIVRDFPATEEFREQHWHVNYGIRFYAGTPLITSDGHAVGTLCLLDTRPVEFGGEQMKALGAFARAPRAPRRGPWRWGRRAEHGTEPLSDAVAAGGYRADCYKLPFSCILTDVLDKGEPVARRGRKAQGLFAIGRAAGLPKGDCQ